MRMIAIAAGLLFSTVAYAIGLAEIGDKDRCVFWANNAMYGASQSMRGAAREVEFISRPRLLEMLMRTESVGGEKLYIVDEEGYTDIERDFLVNSTLFGYDEMSAWKTRNTSVDLIKEDGWKRFMATCLERPAI